MAANKNSKSSKAGKSSSTFAHLDELANIQPTIRKDGDRKVTGGRDDAVRAKLNECTTPAQVADLASAFGISDKEIEYRAKAASNFGQFTMVIGNRMRGIVRRIEDAKAKDKDLSPADAASKGVGRKFLDGAAVKPAKAKPASKQPAKKATKTEAKKTTAKPAAPGKRGKKIVTLAEYEAEAKAEQKLAS